MSKEVATISPAPARRVTSASLHRFPRRAWLALAAVAVVFALPLYTWFRFASSSDLYSYTLLIPAISAYMIWSGKKFALVSGTASRWLAVSLWALALPGLLFSFQSDGPADTTGIFAGTAAFVAALAGTLAWFLDRATLRRLAFPVGFLVFMVPLPAPALHAVETAMQHGSAAAAHALFTAADVPVFYQSLVFELPGVALHVAPECSGIRSTLVLLVVSVASGFFFLRSTTARTALVLLVVPLAFARNGFRIFVIGFLCVRYGPQMIDSFIHRRGGPIFFALSLLPLLLALFLLQKRELRRTTR